jgi:hypothetical protein
MCFFSVETVPELIHRPVCVRHGEKLTVQLVFIQMLCKTKNAYSNGVKSSYDYLLYQCNKLWRQTSITVSLMSLRYVAKISAQGTDVQNIHSCSERK